MNPKIFYRILLITISVYSHAASADKVFIEGSILSSDDKPVKKADVQLLDAKKKKILSIKTDKNGYFKTDEFDAQNCYLQIDKKKESATVIIRSWPSENKNLTGLKIKLSKKAKDFLADKGYDKKYGARPLKRTIQKHVEAQGFSVVQDFCGHGIGKQFHKEPNILHYGKKGTGEKIKTGMIFTIEPMINLGNYETKTLNDGWTAVTKDKSLSAQFEHTIGVTKDGCEIFTLSKNL